LSDEVKETNINPMYVGVAVILLIVAGGLYFWTLDSDLRFDDLDFDITLLLSNIEDKREAEELEKADEVNRFECEQWIEEGKFLVTKNQPVTNTNAWSVEDKAELDRLSANVLLKCTRTGEDLTVSEFNACYDTYYSVRVLLSKMVDMEIDSLTEFDQELYQNKYLEFHSNDCNLVEQELEQLYEATIAGVDFDTRILP